MALTQITSDVISSNAISATMIANGSITSAHVANNTITSAHIVSVSNTAITGNIISSQIASVSNTAITGNIVSSQITSVANTQITGVINSSQLASTAQYMGFKNRIINGNMLIWQRGTTFTNVGSSYSADRWSSSVSSNMTVSQSTDVPNVQYKYSLLVVPAVNATPAEFVIRQWIEQQNIFDFAGQTVTASAWVKCSKSSVTLRIGTQNATGGGDAVSTISVTSGTWTKISYTFTTVFSAITAWTSTPNAAGAFFDIGFVGSTALTTSDYLYITGAQVEVGSQATSFDFRDYGTELVRCQRYYQKSFPISVVPGASGYYGSTVSQIGMGTNYIWANHLYRVPMRTTPTLTFYTANGGAAGYVRTTINGTNIAVTTIDHYSESGFAGFGATGATSSNVYDWNYTASAEL